MLVKDVRVKLNLPQVRILKLLIPFSLIDPVSEWPIFNRSAIQQLIGSTPKSGLVTTAIIGRGQRGGKGGNSVGLLSLGYIESIEFSIEGTKEISYRITKEGISALKNFFDTGGKLPVKKDSSINVNRRYVKED